ncbi:MAG: adenylate/guanylate cyclase domain-containing protein [Rubrivivax sp.]|nr:adenylate/guanylate cyclase domain-containing protein [Rubrivivax sp.]
MNADSPLRDRLLAVLAADVAGYSRLMALDDRATVLALDRAREVFRERIAAHEGRVVDMAGDSVLAVFGTATAAVQTAIEVQRRLAELADGVAEERRMRFRIGVHVGDVIEKDDLTVYGDGVNIAARLEGLAVPGGVAVSQAVHDMVVRRVEAVFDDIGAQAVKNIAEPVRAWRLRRPGQAAADAPPAPVAAGAVAATEPAEPPAGNLPETLPELLGREADVQALKALVGAHRVVTIVGAGGIGKTRLARAVAHALRGDFADGAWMVELAPVADPALLPAAVAQALGVALAGRKEAHDAVADALRGRELLLLLDNCEHLIDAASAFVELLVERAPQLRVLATSQELLKVGEEQLYRVAPLALPEGADAQADPAAARAAGALQLFERRVQALQPAFVLGAQNIADAVEICRRLDGLPLAIEMAAARVPLLGVAGVRQRLAERFRMLTGGARAALRRHQTLRETLDWSHGLLAPGERAVFRRAGVFAGGFSLAAAQHALADTEGGALDEWAVLEHLGALVDKSLVVADPGDPPRYRLLESARAYALEKLREAGETDAALAGHARAMLALFEEVGAQRWTLSPDAMRERCLPDLENLRAALDWSQDHDAALQVALTGASAWIWPGAGQRVEGVRRCKAALARIDAATPPAMEARLQAALPLVSHPRAGPDEVAAAERAVALFRSLGDRAGEYQALARRAMAATQSGRHELTSTSIDEMAALQDPRWPPAARWQLAMLRALASLHAGAFGQTRVLGEQCLELATQTGDASMLRNALFILEQAAAAAGRFEEAVERGRELVTTIRRTPFAGLPGTALGNLSAALTELGELDEALQTARESVAINAPSGTAWYWLDPIALLACKRGRWPAAARALGRAEAANAWRDGRREPNEQRARDQALAMLTAALPADELQRLMAEGAALGDAEAALAALAD